MRCYRKIVSRAGYHEVLECGHSWVVPRKNRQPKPAKRRRCYHCEWLREQYEEQRVELADVYA